MNVASVLPMLDSAEKSKIISFYAFSVIFHQFVFNRSS